MRERTKEIIDLCQYRVWKFTWMLRTLVDIKTRLTLEITKQILTRKA